MKLNYAICCLAIFLLTACTADPNVIPDDDGTPTLPGTPLECDSLLVPNSVFPHAVGEQLVFADSAATRLDTLVCTNNEARSELVDLDGFNGDGVCAEYYDMAFKTNWLAPNDDYSIAISVSKTLIARHEARSVPHDDFLAFFTDFGETLETRYDSILLNGKLFHDVDLYECKMSEPCTFLEALAISKGIGLVAIKRKGEWWTLNQ
jgi:hypothetical protein